MKHLFQEFKTIKGVNGYLKKVGLEDFEMDADFFTTKYFTGEEQSDNWVNDEETNGVSITISKENDIFELSIYKYTSQDLNLI